MLLVMGRGVTPESILPYPPASPLDRFSWLVYLNVACKLQWKQFNLKTGPTARNGLAPLEMIMIGGFRIHRPAPPLQKRQLVTQLVAPSMMLPYPLNALGVGPRWHRTLVKQTGRGLR